MTVYLSNVFMLKSCALLAYYNRYKQTLQKCYMIQGTGNWINELHETTGLDQKHHRAYLFFFFFWLNFIALGM